MMLKKDDIFAGCRILAICGKGASGVVYLAENAIGQRVALKALHTQDAGEKEVRGVRNYMPVHEKASSLVTIHHVGIEDGRLYYIMDAADNASPNPDEYIPDTLAHRLKARSHFSLDETLQLCLSMLEGLSVMHDAGIIHRDIKPENIFFIGNKPVLGDPGLVGDYSHTLSVSGTLGYLPPELLHSSVKPSPNTDIYALGKVLYCMITGNAPGDFPTMPLDQDEDSMARSCRLLAKLCNSEPERRCRNCLECRQLVLETMRRSNCIERLWWRMKMDSRCRRKVLWISTCMLAVFFIVGMLCFWAWSRHASIMREKAAKEALCRKEIQDSADVLRGRLGSLSMQLEAMGLDGNLASSSFAKAESAIAEGKWDEARSALQHVNTELEACAMKHIPPENSDAAERPLEESLLSNARVFAYLSSPLGKWYIPAQTAKELKRKAAQDARILAERAGTPEAVNGKGFKYTRGISFNMKYVPPGRFKSKVTGQLETIDSPFWILDTELTFRLLEHFARSFGQRHGLLEQAASQIGWNDFIEFCHDLTKHVAMEVELPQGYAFRPPTEAEWEYAAIGGSAYEEPIPEKQKEKSPQSPELPSPENALHLKGMDRNLSELVIPYPGRVHSAAWTVVRGANFRSRTTGIANRTDERLDQQSFQTIGFRFVLAPTEKGFYDSAWYLPLKFNTGVCNGKYYVGMESCQALVNLNELVKLARVLGASLPEPQDKDELSGIYDVLQADRRFPALLGIVFSEGKWRRLSNGTEAAFASNVPLPPANSQKTCLGATPSKVLSIAPDFALPECILEFPSEETYLKRPKVPTEHVFEVDGRRFGLLRFRLAGILHSAFVEFAGYKYPVLADRQVLDKVLEQLKPIPGTVSLCCHRMNGEWRWRDSTRLPVNAELAWHGTLSYLMTFGYSVAIAAEGQLRASFSSDYILVEL